MLNMLQALGHLQGCPKLIKGNLTLEPLKLYVLFKT
jgi:hypothetical protein